MDAQSRRPTDGLPAEDSSPVERDRMADYARRFTTERKRAWARQPKRIKDVVAEVIHRRGYGQVLVQETLDRVWREAVEATPVAEFAGDIAVPIRLKRGKLEVAVQHSAVLQEFTFHKQEILAKLRQALPGEDILDIHFRVANV